MHFRFSESLLLQYLRYFSLIIGVSVHHFISNEGNVTHCSKIAFYSRLKKGSINGGLDFWQKMPISLLGKFRKYKKTYPILVEY